MREVQRGDERCLVAGVECCEMIVEYRHRCSNCNWVGYGEYIFGSVCVAHSATLRKWLERIDFRSPRDNGYKRFSM